MEVTELEPCCITSVWKELGYKSLLSELVSLWAVLGIHIPFTSMWLEVLWWYMWGCIPGQLPIPRVPGWADHCLAGPPLSLKSMLKICNPSSSPQRHTGLLVILFPWVSKGGPVGGHTLLSWCNLVCISVHRGLPWLQADLSKLSLHVVVWLLGQGWHGMAGTESSCPAVDR